MTGWRETISKSLTPESIRNIRNTRQKTIDAGEIAGSAYCADAFQDIENEKLESSSLTEIAKARLSMLAKELDHPLENLLDWYKSLHDMETLGSISMDDTRRYVTEYVKYLSTAGTRDIS